MNHIAPHRRMRTLTHTDIPARTLYSIQHSYPTIIQLLVTVSITTRIYYIYIYICPSASELTSPERMSRPRLQPLATTHLPALSEPLTATLLSLNSVITTAQTNTSCLLIFVDFANLLHFSDLSNECRTLHITPNIFLVS